MNEIEIPPAVKKMLDKYGTEFKEIFDAEINWFCSKLCFVGIPDFDIVKLNDFMKKWGYREDKDGCLADFVEKKYGIRGRELINELINMEI